MTTTATERAVAEARARLRALANSCEKRALAARKASICPLRASAAATVGWRWWVCSAPSPPTAAGARPGLPDLGLDCAYQALISRVGSDALRDVEANVRVPAYHGCRNTGSLVSKYPRAPVSWSSIAVSIDCDCCCAVAACSALLRSMRAMVDTARAIAPTDGASSRPTRPSHHPRNVPLVLASAHRQAREPYGGRP